MTCSGDSGSNGNAPKGKTISFEELVKRVKDKNEDRTLRKDAIGFFGRIKRLEAIHVLLELMKNDVDFCEEAAYALTDIGLEHLSFEDKVYCLVVCSEKDEVVKLGEKAIPVVFEVLKQQNVHVRTYAIQILGKFDKPEIIDGLLDVLGEENLINKKWIANSIWGIHRIGKREEDLEKMRTRIKEKLSEVVKRARGKKGEKDIVQDAIMILNGINTELRKRKGNMNGGILSNARPQAPAGKSKKMLRYRRVGAQ